MTRTHSRRLPAALFAAVLLIAFCASTASALAWETVTVDAAGQTGLFTSLALDAAGNPHISYYDDTNDDLKYAWRDGAGWHAVTVDAAGNVGMWTSLALDSAGNPRISYFDDTNDDLKYAWRDGAGWHAVTVDAAGWAGEFSSLALDSAGNPRISYLDRTWNDLMYAWRDGAGWRTERVDAYGILGWYTSLALDSAGNPRISYLVEWTDDLRYAWKDGTGWHFETVDTEGYVGKCSSLVLDGAGNPRISYFDDTFDNKDDLKYAWRDGAGWHNETVDTEGLVGWDTSLALDAAGNPHISYYDDTNDDLKYAWRDGAGWHVGTVDAAGNVGMWTSLALDAVGNPRISYHDRTNGDLKVAEIASPPTPQENVVPGGIGPPADTDGDGLYDDLNGNGRMDFSDVLILFEQREWIVAHSPVDRFDYNSNGLIDFADVVCFFNALGAPAASPITAAFTMDRANGTAPLEVRFTSTSTGPFDDLVWTVTSGQTPFAALAGPAPTFTFQAPGTYAVTLKARNTSTNRSATVTQPVTVTAPSGPNMPYPGPHILPGRIAAEDYDVSVSSPAYADTTTINEGGAYRFDAVDIEVLNRNYNIGWIRKGEFLNYSVDSTAGDFALTLNVANAVPKTEPVRIYLDGVPAGEVWIGLTADWVTFREFAASAPITIPEGRHVVTVSFEGVERLNLDGLNFAALTPTPNVPAAPFPAEHVLPAKIEAEHFDVGGEGAAYHDTEPGNLGTSKTRPGEGVDLETAGGVTNICFVRAGEFLNYSVNATTAGNLTLSLRAANPDAIMKPVQIRLDGVAAGEVPVAPTGGWTAYREFAASAAITIPEGSHVVTVSFDGVERLNLDWLALVTEIPTPTVTVPSNGTPTPTVTSNETPNLTPTVTVTPDQIPDPTPTVTVTPSPTPTPVPAAPYPAEHVLPAKIEAEHFDAGGEGAAYHDFEPTNLGTDRILRPGEGVDLETAGGVTNICFVRAGEFLNYSVNATAAGSYRLTLSAANPDPATKAVRIYLDGVSAGEVPVAPTGGWTVYGEFSALAPLAIPEGCHVVTVWFEEVERINLDWLDIAMEIPTPEVTPTPTATVTAVPGQGYTLTVAGLDLVNERVSIRNTGITGVNLHRCTLSNRGSTCVYTFPAVVLGSGTTVTVHTWSGADTGTDLYWGLESEAWNNLSDTATLRTPDGSFIAAMARQAMP